MLLRRLFTTVVAVVSVLLLTATAALAGHCTVADKNPDAGVQILFDETTGDVTYSQRVAKDAERLGYDLDDPLQGQAYVFNEYHGWFGVDLDGDGEADLSVLFPGHSVEGEFRQLPGQAYENGPDCHGTMEIEDYIENCTGS